MSFMSVSASTINRALSADFTAEEKEMLGNIKDPTLRAQEEAKLKLSKNQIQAMFISNMFSIHRDTAKHIVQNTR